MFRLIKNLIIISLIFIVGYIFGIKQVKFFKIISSSMEPTLNIGDRIVAAKVDEFRRKDIVILIDPKGKNEILVKRIVGLPGEKIKIEAGYLYVNGERIIEPYIKEKPLYSFPERKVPFNCYFLLGDNRNNSEDSSLWGPVRKNLLLGKVFFRYYPLKKITFF